MIVQKQVKEIVEEYTSGKAGYFIVDVVVGRDNAILVEIDNEDAISIGDCEELTRFIEERLDREMEDYELEVGSPGLTTPFKVTQQYVKAQGQEVEVLAKDGKKHKGIVTNVSENGFTIEEKMMVKPEGAKRKVETIVATEFTYDNIKYTKYTINFK